MPVLHRKLLILLLFATCTAFGQTSLQYPVTFSQFFNYYSFLNPAATAYDTRFQLKAGQQFNSGYFSRIRSFFAIAEYNLNADRNKTSHGIGLSFMNHKEGTILEFSRSYLQYAFHLPLSENWQLSGGMAAGFLNFSAEQTTSSGNISSFAPDATAGVWLSGKESQIGFSSSQILNRSITVITEKIPVYRFYTANCAKAFSISDNTKLATSALATFKKETLNLDTNAGLLLNDLIYSGAGYRHKRGTAYFIALRKIRFLAGKADINFAYNIPWPSANYANIQTFELILSYQFE